MARQAKDPARRSEEERIGWDRRVHKRSSAYLEAGLGATQRSTWQPLLAMPHGQLGHTGPSPPIALSFQAARRPASTSCHFIGHQSTNTHTRTNCPITTRPPSPFRDISLTTQCKTRPIRRVTRRFYSTHPCCRNFVLEIICTLAGYSTTRGGAGFGTSTNPAPPTLQYLLYCTVIIDSPGSPTAHSSHLTRQPVISRRPWTSSLASQVRAGAVLAVVRPTAIRPGSLI
ncbi:hypothetical protein BDW22DRAFT_65990 [Trametopsis cervina]|nr:hypothetical protein BDW22DRAFT_65990 [Trametopsis cervina]